MDNIWNLPKTNFRHRGDVFVEITKNIFGNKLIDILEIGVYKASVSLRVFASDLNINSYTGVDPYIGTRKDPYYNSYWKKNSANSVYESINKLFVQNNHKLIRLTSNMFFKENKDYFDLIFVDGDHRFKSVLNDIYNAKKFLKKEGVLIIDDYANVDTPDVTKAINTFIRENQDIILRMGREVVEFQNAGKFIPISLTFVYIQFK
jgi:archaellum biogenesis ATPase FlaH